MTFRYSLTLLNNQGFWEYRTTLEHTRRAASACHRAKELLPLQVLWLSKLPIKRRHNTCLENQGFSRCKEENNFQSGSLPKWVCSVVRRNLIKVILCSFFNLYSLDYNSRIIFIKGFYSNVKTNHLLWIYLHEFYFQFFS